VSYGIIKGHNGRIWCESTPEKGSTFSLELPLVTSD
jgi:signal transduction histidine kinase